MSENRLLMATMDLRVRRWKRAGEDCMKEFS
jgi:hypothetical protein